MAILAHEISAVSAGELLAQDLRIPHYQRPYSWRPGTALQLLEDIRDAHAEDPSAPYVLGAVILHTHDGEFDIVDGQQRLLTLLMIKQSLAGADQSSGQQSTPIVQARRVLIRALDGISDQERNAIAEYINTHCQLVRIVTDDADEAFRVFDSQNYRGRPLAPHDLLKAHHLREMDSDSEALKAAAVETWENAGSERLDELFSTYLYRIARWSKGESAPGFSAHDIDLFKGVSQRTKLTPRARYHLAAQSVMPLLEAWRPNDSTDEHLNKHSRFQLNAPVLAGRSFFEMTDFMLQELQRLRDQPSPFSRHPQTPPETHATWLKRSRYRKTTELYLASLLYYTNCFGDEHLAAAENALFAWAFQLRVRLLRVQHASINNLASGNADQRSAFVLMRNADDGRVVQRLTPDLGRAREDHESALRAALEAMGA